MQLASRLLVSVCGVGVVVLMACGDDAGGGAGAGPVPITGGATAAAPAAGGAGGTTQVAGTPAMTGGTMAPPTGGASATGGTSAGAGAGMMGTGGTGMMPPPAACGAPKPNMAAGNTCPGSAPPALKLTMFASGVAAPTFMAQAPGDPSRFYVLEQAGTIRVIKDGMLQGAPLMDLKSMTNQSGLGGFYVERGLLGMVFDPNFATTKRFWVNFTRTDGVTVVVKYEMTNPDSVDPSSGAEVMTIPDPDFNHNGGMMAFGADGCLYIATGDGGGQGDPQGTGQNADDLLGSILRIDPDKHPTAAPGNFKGHVWSYGLRNPWRFSFDRMSGDMYIGDVGWDPGAGREEVNVEPRGVSGRNYGWSTSQGACSGGCTSPVVDYPTATNASVIGGYVYRGSAIPGLVGRYLYADWSEKSIKSFVWDGSKACDVADTGVVVAQQVRSFAEDLNGELYVLAANGAGLTAAGTIYRIDGM